VRKTTSPPPTPYGRALARLARRDHSEQEIRRGLRRDGFADEEIEETVARLRRDRYLDDAGFAARLARSRMAHAGLGRNRVRLELRKKGVRRATAEAGLSEALTEEVLDGLARRFLEVTGRGRAPPPAAQALGLPAAARLPRRSRARASARAVAALVRRPRGTGAGGELRCG
jgi:SOS response regulatory protein OraA/RecX